MEKFSKEFIKDLNDYCLDHFHHFECIPLEFEWKGKGYKFDEYIKFVDDKIKLWNINV